MSGHKRRRGMRLDDTVVERLPFKRKQYTAWDLSVEGCGVRVSAATKSCVISVRLGEKKKFETIGAVGADSPYEYLREKAIKRIGELKHARLPRTPLRQGDGTSEETLREVLESYFVANPDLGDRTLSDYRKCIGRGFNPQMDQPVSLLTGQEILRLNSEHLEKLAKKDPTHKPPRGFYTWQGALRALRAVLGWHAASKNRLNPWPDRRALKIKSAPARELPVELQSVEGRRRLIEGLKAIDTGTARADRFICYTGFRRRGATDLRRVHLIAENVLEFKSKTRTLRVPLSRQALALMDTSSDGRLLHVGDSQLRKPLIRIFGERKTSRGKKACVTPHDLRRYFKTVGAELGIDPTILNLLVGHAIKGVDKHYIAKLRLSVLRAAAQKITDEIDNPQDPAGEDDAATMSQDLPRPDVPVQCADAYLSFGNTEAKLIRHAHYLKREDLHKLVWTAPVTEIAARIGVSNVGLAKACRRAEIPVPTRGHWAKIEAGQHIGQDPLPPAPIGLPELIRITGTQSPPNVKSKAA